MCTHWLCGLIGRRMLDVTNLDQLPLRNAGIRIRTISYPNQIGSRNRESVSGADAGAGAGAGADAGANAGGDAGSSLGSGSGSTGQLL
jgi:hypothetical protein